MNKTIANALKFITIFFSTTIGLYLIFSFFVTTDFEKYEMALSPGNNKTICPNSPEKELYSDCLRLHIPRLIGRAAPLELTQIQSLITEIKEQDLFLLKDEKKLVIKEAYLKNLIAYYTSLNEFRLSRDNIDYFQILLMPLVRTLLKKQLESVTLEIEKDKDTNLIPNGVESLRKLRSIKIKNQ